MFQSTLRTVKLLVVAVILLLFLVAILLVYYLYRTGSLSDPFLAFRPGPKPGSCLVLEGKYCNKGEAVYYKDALFVGFKLPEGTPIFSPFAGELSNTPTFGFEKEGELITYDGLQVYPDKEVGKITESFSAVVSNENSTEIELRPVSKGEIIGRVSGGDIEFFGDYNLIVYFSKREGINTLLIPDRELIKKLFRL